MDQKPDFNLFLVLDLDPTKPWNQAEFEQRLKEKRGEWARVAQSPSKKGTEANRNRERIPELIQVAADPALRDIHAKAAQTQKNAATIEKRQELEEKLKLLQARGHILEAEVERLVKDYAGHFSEKDIRKKIVVPIKKHEAKKPSQEPLDVTLAKNIEKSLAEVGKTSLYDFLDASEDTQPSILLTRAKTKYDALQPKAKKSHTDTIILELAGGHCKNIFSSSDKTARYNETLRQQKYDNLRKLADVTGAISKEISAAQVEVLLRGAREDKLDTDDALAVLIEYAQKRGYQLYLNQDTSHSVAQLPQCGYCSALNKTGDRHCNNCGKPLQDICPRCGHAAPSSSKACGECGFFLGNRSWVNILILEANQAILERNYTAALDSLTEAHQAWPAEGKDSLGKQLVDLEATVRPKLVAQEQLIKQLEVLLDERRFYDGSSLLPQVRNSLPVGSERTEAYENRINWSIAQAEQLISKAKQAILHQKNLDLAVLHCQEALSICSDCSEAREILAQAPPDPPSALEAVLGEKVISLRWSPSKSQNVAYSIVRKRHSRPVSVNDGDKLATVAGTIFDDAAAEPGIPIYYAVFTDREGVPSNEGAVLPEPILILRDVSDLIAQVNDRQVHLSWTPPPNIHEIQVIRAISNPPRSILDGLNIPVLSNDQAVDNSVENERVYYYRVFSKFRDANGKLLTSDGVSIKAIPQIPPSPIDHVEIGANGSSSNNREVHLRWDAPEKGDVVVIKSNRPTELEFGSVLRRGDLNQYEGLVSTHADGFRDRLDQPGVFYYLPVVLLGDVAYIGREQRFASADDVTNLKVQNVGHALRLQWDWPKNCTEAIVAYSYTDWPILESDSTVKNRLTRAQYNLNGYFDIQKPKTADHYITVFAVIGQGDQLIISSGMAPSARKMIALQSQLSLTYEIDKPSFLKKNFVLSIRVTGQGNLPALVLVGKAVSLPMYKSDGVVIAKVPSQEVNNNQIRVDLSGLSKQSNLCARLFPQDDIDLNRVRIKMPDMKKLRLS